MIEIKLTYLELLYFIVSAFPLIWGLWFSMRILYGATREAIKSIKELNSETRRVWNKDIDN